MGLAPYGKETYCEQIRHILDLNGSLALNLSYFKPLGSNEGMQISSDGTVSLARHFSDRMVKLFGEPRQPQSEITQRDMDLAYAMQHCFEEAFFHLLNNLRKKVPLDNLAMAGGCALNSVANGKLFARTPFRHTWIQPAAGDEGLAVGAALHTYHSVLGHTRDFVMKNSYLGPEFSDARIESSLNAAGVKYRKLDRGPLLDTVTERIAGGDIVGWFQGRMEWGP